MKDERNLRLTASEFLASDKSGLNQQVANARWQFLLALNRKVPDVFERLRNDVYPVFARLAKPGYWSPGRTFSMWQSRWDPDRQLTPMLMEWAHRFHLADEIWILEGALQTLSNWNNFPHCRENLEILGFRKPVCVPGLIADHEHAFHFEDEGWDPRLGADFAPQFRLCRGSPHRTRRCPPFRCQSLTDVAVRSERSHGRAHCDLHLQHAVPIRIGQEFSGYARQVEAARERIESTLPTPPETVPPRRSKVFSCSCFVARIESLMPSSECPLCSRQSANVHNSGYLACGRYCSVNDD